MQQGIYEDFPNAWVRTDKKHVENKFRELHERVKEIIGVDIEGQKFIIHDGFLPALNNRCICSCTYVEILYIVEHVDTGEQFAVGSNCVHKFNDPELTQRLRAIRNGNLCRGSNVIDRRTWLGKLGQCMNSDCICRILLCSNCNEYEKCICPVCPGCHMKKCTCLKCIKCNIRLRRCTCTRCGFCGRLIENCECNRCEACKLRECHCERCLYTKNLRSECKCFVCMKLKCNLVCPDSGNKIFECNCQTCFPIKVDFRLNFARRTNV
jgi:hypothetical protein